MDFVEGDSRLAPLDVTEESYRWMTNRSECPDIITVHLCKGTGVWKLH